MLDGWKRNKKQGLIIKLDFEKDFDNLNWVHILKMLNFMGLPDKWILWMKECLKSSRISLLVNGSPRRGISNAQGDPLSPFLFIIAAEGLNWMFKQAEAHGLISGLEFEIDGLKITHLQNADDTLIFCKATLEDIEMVKRLLLELLKSEVWPENKLPQNCRVWCGRQGG